MSEVYHSSQTPGLEKIEPAESRHWKGKRIYAAKDIDIAALFLSSEGADLLCSIGRSHWSGKPYVCERVKGAFEIRYSGKQGSIYTLPGKAFVEKRTNWSEEVVSEQEVMPIQEKFVADVMGYLLKLQKNKRLFILRYPKKIPGTLLDDDEDLVNAYSDEFASNELPMLERYRPDLVPRILSRVQKRA